MNENEKNLIKEVEKLIGLNLSPTELANKTPHPKNRDKEKINFSFINQLIVIYKFSYRVFYLFIRLQKEFLRIKTAKWQKKLLKALFLAPDYGSIIFGNKSRAWIDQLVKKYHFSKEQKFLLTWSSCIKHKKKTIGLNGFSTIIDVLFLYFLSTILWLNFIFQTIYISLDVIFPIASKLVLALAVAFIYFYFSITKFLFLMIKANVWDSNNLIVKIIHFQ